MNWFAYMCSVLLFVITSVCVVVGHYDLAIATGVLNLSAQKIFEWAVE